MATVTVVGSGASGVHFALSLLRKGHRVRMLDAGLEGPPPVAPTLSLDELRRELDDPIDWFLGEDLSGLTLPGGEGEFYGFPPQKRYVFRLPPGLGAVRSSGFEPLLSHAAGGLAQAWTGGVYPFDEDDLARFPFSYEELAPFYGEVAGRIGVTGRGDDLARFMPVHAHLDEPLDLDGHSAALLRRYEARRASLNARHRCWVGRSRVAVLRDGRDGRGGCEYLGRCLWGCPVDALYVPALTLRECRRYDGFEYESGVLVEAFGFDEGRRARDVTVRHADGGAPERRPVETLALAAGTLSTARIWLESWRRATGERRRLEGLMDNPQALVPFVNVRRIGTPYEPRAYQYHQLALGLEGEGPRDYVHGQITTLTTAQPHPILQSMPLDLKTAAFVFRNVRGALGLVNLNFSDDRRPECRVGLAPEAGEGALDIRYESPPGREREIERAVRRLRRVLRALGCVVAPGSVHVRPMGASVHYAGTLPMSEARRPGTVSPLCRSHDFENVFVVDGSTFPFLPAKNITFTLMANAVRVARRAF